MNALINKTLKYLALVIPFSALLIALRSETVLILFKRGAFGSDAAALTSRVLVFFLTGAFAFAAQTVVVRGFYAKQNTLLPALFSSLAVIVSIPLYFAGLHWYGPSGVALAVSLSAYIQVGVLYVLWNKRTGNEECREVYLFLIKSILLSIPLFLALEYIRRGLATVIGSTGFYPSLAIAVISGVIFVALLLGFGAVFKVQEVTFVFSKLMKKIGVSSK